MKITESKIRQAIMKKILLEVADDERKSEMKEFSESRSGNKVMQQGKKIMSAGSAIYDIAEDQTGFMKQTLSRISEFVAKLGESLSSLNSLDEGASVTESLPTVNEFKQMIKDMQRLEK